VLTHGAARSKATTVRAAAARCSSRAPRRGSMIRATGHPRYDERRSGFDVLLCKDAARRQPRSMWRLAIRSGTDSAVPQRRHGTSEIGFTPVKAAPAHEARAVHHARCRKAPPSTSLERVRGPRKRHRDRVSRRCVDRSWPLRRARPSSKPQPRERRRGERAFTPYDDARLASCVHEDARR